MCRSPNTSYHLIFFSGEMQAKVSMNKTNKEEKWKEKKKRGRNKKEEDDDEESVRRGILDFHVIIWLGW